MRPSTRSARRSTRRSPRGRPVRAPAVSGRFALDTVRREGAAGRAWIDALPGTIESLFEDWELRPDGDPMYGYVGIALPVTQGGRPRVLKVGWIDEHTEHEALALATWAGSGAVRLFGHDPTRGALLLERLDPAVTLESVPVHQAVEVAASLLRRLSVPGPTGPRPMAEIVKRRAREIGPDWERLDRQLPATIVDTAISASARLGSDTAGLLVNEDLHFGNVLRGEREPWLVIDPKPVIGDPEWAVAPLLWNRFPESNVERSIERRFETIVDVARLDRDRARGWTLLRIVETRLWSLRQSLTDDAARCAAIARVLAG